MDTVDRPRVDGGNGGISSSPIEPPGGSIAREAQAGASRRFRRHRRDGAPPSMREDGGRREASRAGTRGPARTVRSIDAGRAAGNRSRIICSERALFRNDRKIIPVIPVPARLFSYLSRLTIPVFRYHFPSFREPCPKTVQAKTRF